jgi:hypothetical protein
MVALLNRLDFFAVVGGALPMLGLWAIFVAPLVWLALPQLNALAGGDRRRRAWLAPAVTAVAALALLGLGVATSGFDAEHPRPNHIAYELDANTGEARWVSADQDLDDWTGQFFAGNATRGEFELDAGVTVPAWTAPAPAVPIATPELTVEGDQTVDGVRTVTLQLTSPREAAELALDVRAQGEITAATINDQALDLTGYGPAADGELTLGYVAPGADGITLTLVVRSTEAIAIDVSETSYGLPEAPGLTVTARPADMMPATGMPLDATVVRKAFSV